VFELTLPVIGTISGWPVILGVVAVILFHDKIPAVIAWSVKKLVGLFASTKQAVTNPTPAQTQQIEAIETGVDKSLDSLQSLTRWAVHDAGPEVLGKVTALYQDIQKKVKEDKPNA
jgi:Sec-independent protein translocase protein TatA